MRKSISVKGHLVWFGSGPGAPLYTETFLRTVVVILSGSSPRLVPVHLARQLQFRHRPPFLIHFDPALQVYPLGRRARFTPNDVAGELGFEYLEELGPVLWVVVPCEAPLPSRGVLPGLLPYRLAGLRITWITLGLFSF